MKKGKPQYRWAVADKEDGNIFDVAVTREAARWVARHNYDEPRSVTVRKIACYFVEERKR